MKYFIDTEFLEDFTHPWIGKSRHYIDLISIGIVAEDGRGFYAVSNEFDIDHVWNKFQMKTWEVKEYWLRDNVLMPVVYELAGRDYNERGAYMAKWKSPKKWLEFIQHNSGWERIWKPRAKELIKKYGQSNKQIAQEIVHFIDARWADPKDHSKGYIYPGNTSIKEIASTDVSFYGYYADYDWVLFCSLYGRMLDLPKGFPMYCNDLKQMLEDKNEALKKEGVEHRSSFTNITVDFDTQHNYVRYQNHVDYPQQKNEHNALADARWNRDLYNFLQSI